jgi:hypothetical protein
LSTDREKREQERAKRRDQRLEKLGQRTDQDPSGDLPEKAHLFEEQIAAYLYGAFEDGRLAERLEQVYALLELIPGNGGTFEMYGGLEGTDFRRVSEERFTRDDGARINFKMTILERKNQPIEILSYSFEICFPKRLSPRFVRFDLNFDDHRNDEKNKRAHVHPGHDDLSFPCQRMHPLEILDLLIYEFRFKKKEREQDWLLAELAVIDETQKRQPTPEVVLFSTQTQTAELLRNLTTQLKGRNSWGSSSSALAASLLSLALELLREEIGE